MGGYVANFIVYTMAMAGLICFAVFVYKKVMDGSFRSNKSSFLSVEETMSLTPRKTLHVVRAGRERFLIASDIDRTTLISKLDMQTSAKDCVQMDLPIEQEELQRPKQSSTPNYVPVNRVRLEPVRARNSQSSHIRKGMDRREGYVRAQAKPVEPDFNALVNNKVATMREMAKKINEL